MKNINRINNVRILNPGFEYSSDNTLRPEAFVSPIISVINSNTITKVDVLAGGKNYTSAPNLVIVNPDTGLEDTTGSILPKISGSAIAFLNNADCASTFVVKAGRYFRVQNC